MTAIARLFSRIHTVRPRPVAAANMNSVRERSRFRNSMPGELGACTAARLYGLGR